MNKKLGENQKVTKAQMEKIRKLEDFDLIMLISDIHDHGWGIAKDTLAMMPPDAQIPPPRDETSKPRSREEVELLVINEIVDAATKAFGNYNTTIVGQSLSALLGLYLHRLGTNEKRTEISKVLWDAAISTCRGLDEDAKNQPTIN